MPLDRNMTPYAFTTVECSSIYRSITNFGFGLDLSFKIKLAKCPNFVPKKEYNESSRKKIALY